MLILYKFIGLPVDRPTLKNNLEFPTMTVAKLEYLLESAAENNEILPKKNPQEKDNMKIIKSTRT